MAVSTVGKKARWWDGDASQRYWMEVVHVEKFGKELVAPEESRHDRMHDVRVGDIVLHWVSKKNPKRLKPGVYGASRVAGELQPNAATWEGKPANRIPLTEYKALREPYLLPELRTNHQEDILGILGRLTQELGHRPKQNGYFPFNRHPTVGLKPNEGYLFKMPRQVIDAVPDLLPESDWGGFDTPLIAPPVGGQNGIKQRYAGFCADPILKKSIEMQAVLQAIVHYEGAGYVVEDVGAYRSYDLLAKRGDEERHIEVKGSQGYVQKVILTRNEVTHANDHGPTDLVVVADIQWERHLDGSIATDAGTMSVYPDWRPSPENLKPLSYEYFLD
ncbi:protein NO VEIN domain-containing protein [Arthrobacter sp. NPDC056886]|uniref:protein NO VEIN domain-containing protein n=1 Tax=Arthrobacter sp. NPDC056886 TaxID=3345960 RepID=UPI00366CF860